MTLRAASDLVTFFKANLVMANVSALTNKPLIRLKGGDDADGDPASGELIMLDEIMKPIPVNNYYRHERYIIEASYYFDGSSETTFKEMLEEMDSSLRTATKLIGRSYRYSMDYTWNTNVDQGVAKIFFELIKEFVEL